MHSFILYNFASQSDIYQKIQSIVKLKIPTEKWPNHPDIHHLYPTTNQKSINQTQSLKIQHIRNLKSKLSRQPLNLSFNLAIIYHSHFLTLAAQNSFLKILEESPKAYIFLITNNLNALIPTIKSRCQIIINKNLAIPKFDQESHQLFEQFHQTNPIKRLKLIEAYQKSQPLAQNFILETMTTVRHLSQKKSSPHSYLILLKNLGTAYQDLGKNLNRKLVLDQLCLNWDQKLTL